MPVLEFNGYTIYHSIAIARFLARQFGLSGRTVVEEAEVDGIIEMIMLLSTYIRPCIFVFLKKLFPKINLKPFYNENFSENSVPMIQKYLPILESYASKKTSHGFLFPSGLTYADFTVAVCYEMIEIVLPQVMIPYTNLKALKDKVNGLPQLQQYLKDRPDYIL